MDVLEKLETGASMALDDYFKLREMIAAGEQSESTEVKTQFSLVKTGSKVMGAYTRLRATMANEESNRLIGERMALASGKVVSKTNGALGTGESTTSGDSEQKQLAS